MNNVKSIDDVQLGDADAETGSNAGLGDNEAPASIGCEEASGDMMSEQREQDEKWKWFLERQERDKKTRTFDATKSNKRESKDDDSGIGDGGRPHKNSR